VALLRNRDYRLWFLSALGSGLGDWTGLVALQVLVTQLTPEGSQLQLFALGGVMMARLLPSIVVGPVAGVIADRYDRKRLMVVSNLARGGIFVAIAFTGEVWALFALVFLVECLTLLFISAKDASLPLLVRRDQLQAASQLNLLATFGPLPLGAVVASAMIPVAALLRDVGFEGATAAVVALLVNAATFLLSALLLAGLRLHSAARARERATQTASPSMLGELREGLAFIWDMPLIRSLITGVVGVFFGAGVIIALGPAFVTESLGQPEGSWFLLFTAVGIGLVTGLITVPLSTRWVRRERMFPVMLVLTGLIALVTGTLTDFTVTMVLGFLLGGAAGQSFLLGYTLLQEHTEDRVRGKTFAAFYTSTRIAMFVALGLGPFAAGLIDTGTLILGDWGVRASGVRIMILLGGGVATVSALLTLRGIYRSLREGAPRPVSLGALTSPASSGLLITVEGVEGAGKSTQARRLAATLQAEGHEVLLTREPGGPPVAERVREVLLDRGSAGMDARTEALLYAAARAEHVTHTIRPALQAGTIVVCDRYLDSSLAYQGHARGLGVDDVAEINRWAIDGVLPDVTILLHVDPQAGLGRAKGRRQRAAARRDAAAAAGPGSGAATTQDGPARPGDPTAPDADRMEEEDADFHRRVAEGFMELVRRNRQRMLLVDSSEEPDVVARQVRLALHPWLPSPPSEGSDATTAAHGEADGPDAQGLAQADQGATRSDEEVPR